MNSKVKYTQLVVLSILLITSCSPDSAYLTRIDEVHEFAHDYAINEEFVEVIGEVTGRVFIPEVTKHLTEIKGYIISDGTSSIIIRTKKYVPLSGEYVRIMGTVRQIAAAGIAGVNVDEFAIEAGEVKLLGDMEYCELKNDLSDTPTDCGG